MGGKFRAYSPVQFLGSTSFISYAQEDESLCEELEKHLKTLQRQNAIASWHDRKIVAGMEINNSAASGRSMKQPFFSTSYAPRGGESTLDEIEK